MQQFTDKTFDEDYHITLRENGGARLIQLDKFDMKLQIWDTVSCLLQA